MHLRAKPATPFIGETGWMLHYSRLFNLPWEHRRVLAFEPQSTSFDFLEFSRHRLEIGLEIEFYVLA
jgi:hypothetical protein